MIAGATRVGRWPIADGEPSSRSLFSPHPGGGHRLNELRCDQPAPVAVLGLALVHGPPDGLVLGLHPLSLTADRYHV